MSEHGSTEIEKDIEVLGSKSSNLNKFLGYDAPGDPDDSSIGKNLELLW